MNFKQASLCVVFRLIRIVGILLVIYVSMVFYLALTERRNAYPRAITHKEAEAAIQGSAKTIHCSLEDGTDLEGWLIGTPNTPSLLYYPDANEDAAQFLAEVQNIEGYSLIAFNYRGSANNKGTPSSENFGTDGSAIAECASQISGQKPASLAGRGTGAILAAEQLGNDQTLILIDPVASIADAIADKYRVLYPKFLIRAKEKLPINKLKQRSKQVILLSDRKQFCDRNHSIELLLEGITHKKRGNSSLKEQLTKILFKGK